MGDDGIEDSDDTVDRAILVGMHFLEDLCDPARMTREQALEFWKDIRIRANEWMTDLSHDED